MHYTFYADVYNNWFMQGKPMDEVAKTCTNVLELVSLLSLAQADVVAVVKQLLPSHDVGS